MSSVFKSAWPLDGTFPEYHRGELDCRDVYEGQSINERGHSYESDIAICITSQLYLLILLYASSSLRICCSLAPRLPTVDSHI